MKENSRKVNEEPADEEKAKKAVTDEPQKAAAKAVEDLLNEVVDHLDNNNRRMEKKIEEIRKKVETQDKKA